MKTIRTAVFGIFAIFASSTMAQTNLPTLNVYKAVELEFFTKTNQAYQIQTSTNFSTWTDFDSVIWGNDSNFNAAYSVRQQPNNFFRIKEFPLGLIGFYPFSGNANDASGNNNNGSVNGAAAVANRVGNQNGAYNFIGTSTSFISIPDSSSLDMTNALTVALWIRTQGGGYAQPRILSKGPPAYEIDLSDTGTNPSIYFGIQNLGYATTSPISIVDNNWIFIAATYDGQSMKIYTNSLLAGQFAVSGSIGVNNEPLGIGKNTDNDSDYFKGSIDDVRIYNRALTQAEISRLYLLIP